MKISTVWGAPKARVIFLVLLVYAVALAARAAETNKEKQQKQIRGMAQDTLQRLYKAEPKTEAVVKHAFGYAVFRQGSHAPGGAKDYMADGKMTGGFAFVAYPAEYRNSGVMTFIINQDGVLLQKDLGSATTQSAAAMTEFDLDPSWTPAQK